MEQISSWEADSHSASQEIPCFLWKPEVPYFFDKVLPEALFNSS
jgi:hypothetical protein